MVNRTLGKTDRAVSPIGFGAFKIGRNQGIKYPSGYDLPDDATTERLLNGVLDLGINLIDTAPAYGISEERIGRFIAHRRSEFTLSTKAGETFEGGRSHYDYSAEAVRQSVHRSLLRLRTDVLDIALVHSDGRDEQILIQTDIVPTLQSMRNEGLIRWIGLSGKSPEAARQAMTWADVLMVEYHSNDTSHESVIAQAHTQGVGVIVKKGLASGAIPANVAVPFILKNPGVASLVVGGLNLDHFQANIALAT